MRINKIQISNFRGIEELEMELDKQFTLLVGENGSGKTSILSALAVALGIWRTSGVLDDADQWRNIEEHEVREYIIDVGDAFYFTKGSEYVEIFADGEFSEGAKCEWKIYKRSSSVGVVDTSVDKDGIETSHLGQIDNLNKKGCN